MSTVPIWRTTGDITSITVRFLVLNGRNTAWALQALIADAFVKRREAHQRELAQLRSIGDSFVQEGVRSRLKVSKCPS